MNWAFWFMVLQVITCAGGAIGYAFLRNYPIAWVWACYAATNIGFAMIALKGS